MKTQKITPEFTVSAQINANDIAEIKANGFNSVICNRPDDEEMGQPTAQEILSAAEASGLAVRHIPVISGMLSRENVDDMAIAISEMPKPIFAYCRSGARCTQLFQYVEMANRG